MKVICEKIRRSMPDFPDCQYPWEVLHEMKQNQSIILPRKQVDGLDNAIVYAHESVEIQPYCLFSGLVILEEGVRIGPYSFLRGPIYIGHNSTIGPHAEIIRCVVMDDSNLAHKNLVGDAIFGNNVNFAGMSVVCNTPVGKNYIKARYKEEVVEYKGKYGAFIEDNCNLGCLTILMPGCYIPENSNIIGQCVVHGQKKIKPFCDYSSNFKVQYD